MSGRQGIKTKFLPFCESHYTKAVVYGPEAKVHLGEHVNLMNALINTACGSVTIGDGTFCGHNVCILTGSHQLDGVRPRWKGADKDIHIGRFVWLGSNCTIIGPCTIGDRAVIAAGAVVTKDCEPGWIYAGVPAKKLRLAEDARADQLVGGPASGDD